MNTSIHASAQAWAHWPTLALQQAIAPLLPGCAVQVLPRIDSTSAELMRRARAAQAGNRNMEPLLLVAETQTAGRGRLGRPWHTGAWKGTGTVPALTFSLGLPLAPRQWAGLSLAAGVAVAEGLQPALPAADSGLPRILLKWPNDLWTQDGRKLGGILVETVSLADAFSAPYKANKTNETARYVIIGIGLNVLPVSNPDISTPPACLREVDATLTAAIALEHIAVPLVQTLLGFAEHGFIPFQPRFALRDVLAGRAVTLSNGLHGTAWGVGEDGALLIHTASGMQAVTSADVSVRPATATTAVGAVVARTTK